MKNKSKNKFRIILLIILLVGSYLFWNLLNYNKNRRVNILYKIDHQQLLFECRKLMEEKEEGKWPLSTYGMKTPESEEYVKRLPRIIKDIKPSYICISDKVVQIEMAGVVMHYGIIVYKSDSEMLLSERKRVLMPGMVYYDDKFLETKDWDKYLEEIKP